MYDFGASENGGHDNVSCLVGKGADFKTMIFRWGSDGHGHVACKSFCAWNSRPTVSTNQFKIHSENISCTRLWMLTTSFTILNECFMDITYV